MKKTLLISTHAFLCVSPRLTSDAKLLPAPTIYFYRLSQHYGTDIRLSVVGWKSEFRLYTFGGVKQFETFENLFYSPEKEILFFAYFWTLRFRAWKTRWRGRPFFFTASLNEFDSDSPSVLTSENRCSEAVKDYRPPTLTTHTYVGVFFSLASYKRTFIYLFVYLSFPINALVIYFSSTLLAMLYKPLAL